MANILPPCKLLEFDFSGIELVLLGWYAARLTDNPMVIRFGKLGAHALVASHVVGKPPDMSWPDAELAAYFKQIKKQFPDQYDTSKRTVHGTGYGLTPEGMVLIFPAAYSSLAYAQKVQKVYFDVCPPVPAFQLDIKKRAAKQNYLGGPIAPGKTLFTDTNAHVFTYEHKFWNVVEYRKLSPAQVRAWKHSRSSITAPVVEIDGVFYAMKWGPDSKRALAFYPQSTARGILAESEIPLFYERDHPWFIGDAYYGQTPLRGPIHDSLFMEVPWRQIDRVKERTFACMTRPIIEMPMKPEWHMGEYLTIGVEAKIGDNWADMEELTPQTLLSDLPFIPDDEADDEEAIELRTAVA